MEVEAAELAGYVDYFSDEIEAGDGAALHGLRGECGGADAAGGDFGLLVAFGSGGREGEAVQTALQVIEGGVGPVRWRSQFSQLVGEAGGQRDAQRRFERGEITAGVGRAEGREEFAVGKPVDVDGLGLLPIGRDLQDGRAAEAAMREEHLLAKAALAGGSDDRRRDAGEAGKMRALRTGEGQRNERGAAGFDGDAELARDVVAETSGADFGNGEASGGDDESGSRVEGVAGGDGERAAGIVAAHFMNVGGDEDAHLGVLALAHQHVDDLLRGAVAEELAQRLLVPCDAVALDETDEVGGRVACQGRFGKVGIGGEEIVGAGVQIGEIASATAGDEDLFAGAAGALEHSNAAAAAASLNGGHEAGGASAEDENVETVCGHDAEVY